MRKIYNIEKMNYESIFNRIPNTKIKIPRNKSEEGGKGK
jgi:hypothetical protein